MIFLIQNSFFRLQKIVIRKLQNLHFLEGLVPSFGEKSETFLVCVVSAELVKEVWGHSCRKIAFLEYENIHITKFENLHFSTGVSPWFWRKIWSFFTLPFFGQIVGKNGWQHS